MIVGGFTDIGLIRIKNQDNIFVGNIDNFPLYIVADGMGGHNAGEIASKMAIDIIKDVFLKNMDILKDNKSIKKTIDEAIFKSNEKIYLESLKVSEYTGMGTTLSLVYIDKKKAHIGHVGDSRVYLITHNRIRQITEDHSLVNELIKNGSITPAEAKIHPQKNMITRAVGTSSDILLDYYTLDYEPNDILLICSDGLSNMIKDEDILDVVNNENNIENACRNLINLANENGGKDNITVILVKF